MNLDQNIKIFIQLISTKLAKSFQIFFNKFGFNRELQSK